MVVRVVPVSTPEVAEACKILENTYRAVNIALVNELKILFDRMGIDVWEVIEAAKTKPFGFQAFYPGPGLGGHCIPIDPFYLSWVARKHGFTTRFIELAGEINTSMPAYVVRQGGRRAQRPGQADQGKPDCGAGDGLQKGRGRSPGIARAGTNGPASEKGAEVSFNDPHIPRLPTSVTIPNPPDGQPTALPRIPRRAGLRPDCHRPLGLRLALGRRTCLPGCGHPERDQGSDGPPRSYCASVIRLRETSREHVGDSLPRLPVPAGRVLPFLCPTGQNLRDFAG